MGWGLKEMEWLQPSLVLSPDVRPASDPEPGLGRKAEGGQERVGSSGWAANGLATINLVCRYAGHHRLSWHQGGLNRPEETTQDISSPRHTFCPVVSQTVRSTSFHRCETNRMVSLRVLLLSFLCLCFHVSSCSLGAKTVSQLTCIKQSPPLLPMKTKSFPSSFHNNSYFSHALLSEDLFGADGPLNQMRMTKIILRN